MKKLKLITIAMLILTSCSSNNDDENTEQNIDCNIGTEPNVNEFTLACETYDTEYAKILIVSFGPGHPLEDKFYPLLSFSNFTSDFPPSDIYSNLIKIKLDVIFDSATDQIQLGTYSLDSSSIDSASGQSIIFNGNYVTYTVSGGTLITINYDRKFPGPFEDVLVNISKDGDIYTIDYTLTQIDNSLDLDYPVRIERTVIKGKYVGELVYEVQ